MNPLDQFLHPCIGQELRGLGDLGHLIQQSLFLFEEFLGATDSSGAAHRIRHGGDLRFFFGCELLLGERGPVIIRTNFSNEQVTGFGLRSRSVTLRLRCLPLPLNCSPVDP
jgi:hypothetical protein